MKNGKLFGFLIMSLWVISIITVTIGCINFKNTGLAISLIVIGILITWISSLLIDAVEGYNYEE